MLEYKLFGKTVVFDDAAERYFDLSQQEHKAEKAVSLEFKSWYEEQRSIEKVISEYENYAFNIVKEMAAKPIMKMIKDYQIYDVSVEEYVERCMDGQYIESAIELVEGRFYKIIDNQEAEREYRAARKANRGRWQGGGFGVGGALKGAMKAGAMNAVTGMGHSLVNAAGNAGAAANAAVAKQNLYQNSEIKNILEEAILQELVATFGLSIQLINERKGKYIYSTFDSNKAMALFQNAKEIVDKQCELLPQAVARCPWSVEILRYIFQNFPEERGTVCRIAQRFGVDLKEEIERILGAEYKEDINDEEKVQEARRRILALMDEFNIKDSDVLNRLESDGLARVCMGVEIADEVACKDYIARVNSYAAKEENKKPFLEKIQQRIEQIWTSEDAKVFDELYLKTNIKSKEEVEKAKKYIEQCGRTDNAKKYLEALDWCSEKNIKRARRYKKGIYIKINNAIGIASFIDFLFNIFLIHAGIMAGISMILVCMVCIGIAFYTEIVWDTLTIDNTVFHPILMENLKVRGKWLPTWILTILFTIIILFILMVMSF